MSIIKPCLKRVDFQNSANDMVKRLDHIDGNGIGRSAKPAYEIDREAMRSLLTLARDWENGLDLTLPSEYRILSVKIDWLEQNSGDFIPKSLSFSLMGVSDWGEFRHKLPSPAPIHVLRFADQIRAVSDLVLNDYFGWERSLPDTRQLTLFAIDGGNNAA